MQLAPVTEPTKGINFKQGSEKFGQGHSWDREKGLVSSGQEDRIEAFICAVNVPSWQQIKTGLGAVRPTYNAHALPPPPLMYSWSQMQRIQAFQKECSRSCCTPVIFGSYLALLSMHIKTTLIKVSPCHNPHLKNGETEAQDGDDIYSRHPPAGQWQSLEQNPGLPSHTPSAHITMELSEILLLFSRRS